MIPICFLTSYLSNRTSALFAILRFCKCQYFRSRPLCNDTNICHLNVKMCFCRLYRHVQSQIKAMLLKKYTGKSSWVQFGDPSLLGFAFKTWQKKSDTGKQSTYLGPCSWSKCPIFCPSTKLNFCWKWSCLNAFYFMSLLPFWPVMHPQDSWYHMQSVKMIKLIFF